VASGFSTRRGEDGRRARRKFRHCSARGESIAFSANTDCYQPLEASYELTRRCLEVCLAHDQAVGIITKGTVIRRDIELIAKLHERAGAYVHVSIAFADDEQRRAFDPFAPPIDARFETMKRLADAGIPVGLALPRSFPASTTR
jgi:DNA repair photolyase